MINILFNWHTYLMGNLAIALGYFIFRFIVNFAFLPQITFQSQKLKFSRYFFCFIVFSFIAFPTICLIIPFSHDSGFVLAPILKSASITFLNNHVITNNELTRTAITGSSSPTHFIFLTILSLGIIFYFLRYIKTLITLNNLKRDSFCRHEINNVKILFQPSIEIPFCWSSLKKHYIALPYSFLERNTDLRLAIRHELQHIRQGDTHWLHFFMLIKIFCFWNPFVKLWINYLNELQEFSCDETLVLRKKTSITDYAQCLVNTTVDTLNSRKFFHGTLGINHLSQSILYRRVNMLFNYKTITKKSYSILFAYLISFFAIISTAYAFSDTTSSSPLTYQQIEKIIQQSNIDKSFQISANPEVVNEINHIRSSDQARSFMRNSLQRMKQYQPIIQAALKQNHMPNDLLVMPLVESGYRPLAQNINPVQAAGVWQIIPDTAKKLGLVVNANRDDRFNTSLATNAALSYLQHNYDLFKNWKLACIAYEIGENNTAKLISATNSYDATVLAQSPEAPKSLKNFIAMLDAEIIIMHDPSILKA
jgi:beta-lactamase regulating signal transducer with metallopeptidase domain